MDKNEADIKAHDQLLSTLKRLTEEIGFDGDELYNSDEMQDKDRNTDLSREDKTA